MKRSRKITLLVLAVLIALTAAVAVIHLSARTEEPEGAIRVECAGESVTVAWDTLELVPVQGQMKTGKGELREIDAQGILLQDLIRAAGFDPADCAGADVAAADSYHAQVSRQELLEEDKVYVIAQETGGFRQIVFGDENSKRNISDLTDVFLLTEDSIKG